MKKYLHRALIAGFLVAGKTYAQTPEWGKIYKVGNFLVWAKDTMTVDLIKTATGFKNPKHRDTLYSDNKYMLFGNADKLLGVYKRYKIPYVFSEYKVSVYTGKLASPDFKTDTAAYRFRTQIRNQCKSEGVNFAGHYTVVMWGCGSDCRAYTIVDRITGCIYYSALYKTDYEFDDLIYKRGSKMLIMNGQLLKRFKGYVRCSAVSEVKVVKWNNDKFQLLAAQH